LHSDIAPVSARYFPAEGSVRARAATLTLAEQIGTLRLSVDGESAARDIAVSELRASERFATATRTVHLANGDMLEVDDSARLSRLLTAAGKPDALVTRWQHSLRMVAFSLIASLVIGVAAYLWGLPVAADVLARRVPDSWSKALDRAVIAQLTTQGSLEPSKLDAETQARLRARFQQIAASTAGSPVVDIRFQRIGNMANAFALPGGTIVFLDGIVNMAPDDAALAGVFAHELGHVQHRHGLRTLIRTAAVSAVAAWYFGDFTSLANAAIIMSQLSYSRDFETEADDEAIAGMRANSVDPRSIAELFRRMRDRGPFDDDEPKEKSTGDTDPKSANKTKRSGPLFSIPEFLSTHPDIERRIERFEKAR